MSYHLTIVNPFGNYRKGDHITDATEVAKVLAGPNAHSVVKRFPHPEHVNGDFYRTNEEMRARAEALFSIPKSAVEKK